MLIGKNRLEAIDWVQERMEKIARPLAEATFFGLLKEGLLTEAEGGVSMSGDMDGEELRKVGIRQTVRSQNTSRQRRSIGSHIMTRRHPQHQHPHESPHATHERHFRGKRQNQNPTTDPSADDDE